jgi:hypothetical protein
LRTAYFIPWLTRIWQDLKEVSCFEAAGSIEPFVVLAVMVKEVSSSSTVKFPPKFERKMKDLSYEL